MVAFGVTLEHSLLLHFTAMLLALTEPSLSTSLLWFSILITVVTILSMARLRSSEESLQKQKSKLEEQIVGQQLELIRTREDAAAWRLDHQRQFDAFRAESSKHLADAEQRAAVAQQHLDDTIKRSWKTETDLRQALERALKLAGDEPDPALFLPLLPAVPDAVLESTESGFTASDSKIVALQRLLVIERFKARRALKKAKAAA